MTPVHTSDPTLEELVQTDGHVPAPALPRLRRWSTALRVHPALSVLMRLLPVLRVVGYAAAVAVVVVMAVRAVRGVDLSNLIWWPLPLAFVAATVWWVLLARGWALLVSGTSRRTDISTWCRTQVLRYLPGGIWAPVSRVVAVRGTVLDKFSTVAAENIVALCAALSIGGVSLALTGDLRWLPLALVVVAPVVGSRLVARRTRIAPARTLDATWNYLAGFFAYVIAAVLVQTAVSGGHDLLNVAGAAAIAWAAGLVVVIAPSGVGVRELVYVALLAALFPTAELAAAAVTMRLVTVFAELAVLLVAGRPAVPAE